MTVIDSARDKLNRYLVQPLLRDPTVECTGIYLNYFYVQPALRSPVVTNTIQYIQKHPFTTMAACNIIGDVSFLGFSVGPHHTVSVPQMLGALVCFPAHALLMGHGDTEAAAISKEDGKLSQMTLKMQKAAKWLTKPLTETGLIKRPVATSFGLLAFNGLGLMTGAASKFMHQINIADTSQLAAGLAIATGCTLFAAADLTKNARTSEQLRQAAPQAFLGATTANTVVAASTLNPFMIVGAGAFWVSNLAAFFTKTNSSPQTPTESVAPRAEKSLGL